ncbi:MAG: hypothetical protein KC470_12360, partial [Dehalococcoidia bacterium]|nr:hypothetical protein [Dehalococcoidia bacterium]
EIFTRPRARGLPGSAVTFHRMSPEFSRDVTPQARGVGRLPDPHHHRSIAALRRLHPRGSSGERVLLERGSADPRRPDFGPGLGFVHVVYMPDCHGSADRIKSRDQTFAS